ncbi:inorganic diphosphatase [Haematospirillum jordaniae]|uniref:Inorganic pyrophosphatase n=1 Tax=Haematospirillum jordaniae TaxID=1549855 RepID=A0A143DCP8_9PROT|nr:inorganic diphosphatase [Haematospirillum jordaniae]AMW34521.1 inorganic pyrophosphatase [Haematospirillum jordaniae]NKD44920.1 inorganic diphosphatase [Haematospirillum jordaniae]NKD57883.1 inorganic diphosphatase [Haematospirillum jordaniae]NKD59844.1 inorganic diphosphatase [Haematospirillum jordaniae]NKD67711.1 inorganic diphosphatase [Haematospirillum jordaniae]
MDIKKIPIGNNPPHDVNVIIEIPLRSDPVKYEVDKESGAMYVDRFLHTAMHYPCNYGFIPHTLSDDNDPIDVMVVSNMPVAVGSVLRSRPVGVLYMEDESGGDEKILAVPHSKLHPYHDNVQNYTDLRSTLIRQIEHFFVHYKDLEEGKWAKVKGWGDAEAAGRAISEAIERAKQKG